MKTKHHYPTLLIALILGLMMTTGAAWAQDTERPKTRDGYADPIIRLSKSEITMDAQGGTDGFTLTTNQGWNRDFHPREAASYEGGWIKISGPGAVAGTGEMENRDFTIEVSPNTSTEDRTATITFWMSGVSSSITVKQKGKPAPIISLSKSEITMDAAGGRDGFTLRTDQGWNRDFHPREAASYEGGWIKISGPGAVAGTGEMENRDFTIEVSPNTSTKERTATITFWMSEVSSSITVKQKGAADTEKPKSGGYVDGYPKAVSPTEIEVKWNPGTDEGGTAQEDLEYEVAWVIPSSGDESDWDGADRSSTLQTCEYKIRGLNPNTEYLVDVMVLDKANNATWYGEKTIKTPAAETPKPEPKPEPGPSEAVLVSSVMLDQPKVSIDGDRASFQLKASVLPANATNSELQWSSSNPSVASVEAASTASLLKAGVTGKAVTVHIHKKGKAEITAQAMDGSGKSASCQVNVLSTVGNIEAAATRIYASGSTLRLILPQAAVVRIYNVSGTLVHMLNASAGDTSVALSAGVYVVRVDDTVQKVRIE